MIKIVIAEDEIHALMSLKQKIQDIGWPYEVIGEALNGELALKIITEAKPDLLLTDIKMPIMDGMELIKEVKESYPTIIPVILSGHQEFEYARQAVKLGVDDYLLKPIDVLELNQCLDNCKEKITEDFNKREYEKVMAAMLNQTIDVHDDQSFERYAIAYAIIGNCLNYAENGIHPSVHYLDKREMDSILSVEPYWKSRIWCFDGQFTNEKTLIVKNDITDQSKLTTMLNRLKEQLSRVSGFPVTISLAPQTQNLNEITGLIRKARKLAVHSLIIGKSQVVSADCKTPEHNAKSMITNEILSSIISNVSHKQLPLLKRDLEELFAKWASSDSPFYIIQKELIFLLNAVQRLLFTANDFQGPGSEFYVENIISASKSMEELLDHLHALIDDMIINSNSAHPKHSSATELVKKAEGYLKSNLSNPITLKRLSEYLEVSQVYLCRVFKKYKNVSPIDYFIKLKIEKAKELIKNNPEIRVKEIAEQLGFENTYYFGKVYKRMEKISPSEYRKMINFDDGL